MKLWLIGAMVLCLAVVDASASLADVEITELKRRIFSVIGVDDGADMITDEDLNEELSGTHIVDFEQDAFGSRTWASHNTSAVCNGRLLLVEGILSVGAGSAVEAGSLSDIRNDVALWFSSPPGQIYPPVGTPFRVAVRNPFGNQMSVAIFDIDQGRYLWSAWTIDGDLDASGLLQGSGNYYFGVLTRALSVAGIPLEDTAGLEFLFEVLDDTAVATEEQTWGTVKALFR